MYKKETMQRCAAWLMRNRLTLGISGSVLLLFWFGVWLLLNAVAKQNALAYRSTCTSNLKNIGVALGQYVLDNDDSYPWSGAWNDAPRTIPGVRGCPAAAALANLPRLKADGVPGYALNQMLTARKRADVVYPATTVAVCEQALGIPFTRSVNPYAGFPFYPKQIEKGWLRHGGGANYLFCDGHVAWFAPKSVQSDTANDVLDRNNGVIPTFVLQSTPSISPH